MSLGEIFNTEIAPLANTDIISVEYDFCEVADCFDLATVRVKRVVDPLPMDPSENYLADCYFCDDHYRPDEERDLRVVHLAEVRS